VTLIFELTLLPSLRTAIDMVKAPLPESYDSGRPPGIASDPPMARLEPAGGREYSLSLRPQLPALAARRLA